MERLTEFRKDLGRYEYKQDEQGYCYLSEEQLVNKLGKLEDLEEQVSCPLEVRCQLHNNSYIFDKNSNWWRIIWIEKDFIRTENVDNRCEHHDFLWIGYKTTWWLKQDRSE